MTAYCTNTHAIPATLVATGFKPLPNTQLPHFSEIDGDTPLIDLLARAISSSGDVSYGCTVYPKEDSPELYLRETADGGYEFLIHESDRSADRHTGRGIPFAYAVSAVLFAMEFFDQRGYRVEHGGADYANENGVSIAFVPA